jgi:hypothetical protein
MIARRHSLPPRPRRRKRVAGFSLMNAKSAAIPMRSLSFGHERGKTLGIEGARIFAAMGLHVRLTQG